MDQEVAALLSALDKLPGFEGVTFRGHAAHQGPTGKRMIISGGLVATSRDPRVATENFTTTGVYAVIGNAGRDITRLSAHPFEQEVVFRPGTMFLPIEQFGSHDLDVTIVEQLDPDRKPGSKPKLTLEQVRQSILEAIERSRAEPTAEGITAGKFVGPLT